MTISPRPQPLSTRIGTRAYRRRLVVALYVGYPVSIAGVWYAGQLKETGNTTAVFLPGAVALIAIGATIVAYFLLMRRTVINLPNVAETALDERQRRVRDGAFRTAYLSLAGTITIAAAAVWLLTMFAPGAITVTNGAGQAIWWAVFILTGTLPTAVIAWHEPDAWE